MTPALPDSTHNSMVELLPWYINGTLSGDEHRTIEDHLGICEECRDNVEALSRVSHLIRNDSPAPIVPPLRTEALLEALDRPEREPPGFRKWVPYAAAASVALLLATAWITLGNAPAPAELPTMFETATSADTEAAIGYVVEITFEVGTRPDKRDASLAEIDTVGSASPVGEAIYRVTLQPVPGSLAELEQRLESIEALPGIASARVVAVQLPVD